MKPTVTAGVVLGILVVVWTFVMGFTGWYKDPAKLSLFYLVIVFEIGVLIWGLRKTAALGNNYMAQVLAGLAIAGIASVFVFCGSYLFTTVAFPQYFEEIRAIQSEQLKASGMPEDQIQGALEMAKAMQTPVVNAVMGVVGTMITGLLASLVIAAFVRAKKPA
ncbi:MAG TPA: DUF4199 domain-containing protein [Candidatus Polarisedimenticolaceae bacterium]